ncbi:hypothetical protein [Tenacibaculum piscium]|uniref:hypothetical protein n=1 Tax=Tenacibaculum piscium TaxID=1458515 RepID=UPI0023B9AA2F|nr:hypothetical protein [Tenacibaculum piscium]
MGKDEYIEFKNGTKFKIITQENSGTGEGNTPLHPSVFFFDEVTFINSSMINRLGNRISASRRIGLDYHFMECLKRKSITVDKHNLETFIKEKCRCEDNLDLKHRTYFVNDIPLLLHKYRTEVSPVVTSDGEISIKADLGSFIYL